MSSVAPREAEITYLNGSGSIRPRLAERIARSRAITIDVMDRLEDELPANDAELASGDVVKPTLVAVLVPSDDAESCGPADAAAAAVLLPRPADDDAADTHTPIGSSELDDFTGAAPGSSHADDLAAPLSTGDREPAAIASEPDAAAPFFIKLDQAALAVPFSRALSDGAIDVAADPFAAEPLDDVPLDAVPLNAVPGAADPQPDLLAFIETDGPVLTDARAIEAASQLVSLIAEQRTLLDAIQRAAATATARQLDAANDATASADGDEEASRAAIAFERSAPTALLPHMSEPASHPALEPASEAERPPMMIERAHADHRAGIAWPTGDRADPPRRLASFAMGFGMAMVIGAAYWSLRSIV